MNQVRRSNYGREYVDGNTVRKLNPDRDRRVYVDGKRVQENERQIRAREYVPVTVQVPQLRLPDTYQARLSSYNYLQPIFFLARRCIIL